MKTLRRKFQRLNEALKKTGFLKHVNALRILFLSLTDDLESAFSSDGNVNFILFKILLLIFNLNSGKVRNIKYETR